EPDERGADLGQLPLAGLGCREPVAKAAAAHKLCGGDAIGGRVQLQLGPLSRGEPDADTRVPPLGGGFDRTHHRSRLLRDEARRRERSPMLRMQHCLAEPEFLYDKNTSGYASGALQDYKLKI